MAAINHQPTDRVPTDYWGVPEITQKLMDQFEVSDMLGLAKALDIDKIMGVDAFIKPGNRKGMWDIEMKKIPLADGIGYYDEPAKHPIYDYETIDEIEANYIWPTTDMFDYSHIRKQCELYKREGYAIEGGYISLTYFYEMIRGTEQMFIDFAINEKLAEYILYNLNDFASKHTQRILEEADGMIDITQVTDDLGSQNGLLMSETMIERYLGKYYKAKYGDKLCFHGGIDNQNVLPFGSIEDVKAEVEACINALYSDKTGYILAPCHNIQAITPVENIITMYDHAKKF